MKETSAVAGLQKLTLLDYPKKTACTLFTAGCNFACPYCHNKKLIPFDNSVISDEELIAQDYIIQFLKSRHGLLDGVCLSGGEPLAREGVFDLIHTIKDLGFLVKVDTNGSYPDRLIKLAETQSIDFVAMDIKNTLPKYPLTIDIPGFDTAAVKESIGYLLKGKIEYEFRTTVVRQFHTEEDLITIAGMIKDADNYFLQQYICSDDTGGNNLTAYSTQELQALCESVRRVLPKTELRGI